jgi:hypothetical protein
MDRHSIGGAKAAHTADQRRRCVTYVVAVDGRGLFYERATDRA